MRKPRKVPLGDQAALLAWIAETHAIVEDLYTLMLDASAPKQERRHARVFLRHQARRHHKALGALFAALDPGAPISAVAVSEADLVGQEGDAA